MVRSAQRNSNGGIIRFNPNLISLAILLGGIANLFDVAVLI